MFIKPTQAELNEYQRILLRQFDEWKAEMHQQEKGGE